MGTDLVGASVISEVFEENRKGIKGFSFRRGFMEAEQLCLDSVGEFPHPLHCPVTKALSILGFVGAASAAANQRSIIFSESNWAWASMQGGNCSTTDAFASSKLLCLRLSKSNPFEPIHVTNTNLLNLEKFSKIFCKFTTF